MKTLFTITFITCFQLFGSGQVEIEDTNSIITCNFGSQKLVTHLAYLSWRRNQELLRSKNIIHYEGLFDHVHFSYNKLCELYGGQINENSSGKIVFRFYLDEDPTNSSTTSRNIKIAVTSSTNPHVYLIKKDGSESIVHENSLQSKFIFWQEFLESHHCLLIPVTLYTYCWNYIGSNIHHLKGLHIEKVSRVVESCNQRYCATTCMGSEALNVHALEGFFAFDIAIKYEEFTDKPSNQESIQEALKHDFAVPCPKACPDFIENLPESCENQ